MKFIYTLIALTLFAVQIHAQQTYTEKLRQNEAGKGTVIINQSPEIEQVVNGKVQQKSETKGRITALPATGDKPVTTGTSTNEGKISHHTTATSHTSTSHATATNASKKKRKGQKQYSEQCITRWQLCTISHLYQSCSSQSSRLPHLHLYWRQLACW